MPHPCASLRRGTCARKSQHCMRMEWAVSNALDGERENVFFFCSKQSTKRREVGRKRTARTKDAAAIAATQAPRATGGQSTVSPLPPCCCSSEPGACRVRTDKRPGPKTVLTWRVETFEAHVPECAGVRYTECNALQKTIFQQMMLLAACTSSARGSCKLPAPELRLRRYLAPSHTFCCRQSREQVG